MMVFLRFVLCVPAVDVLPFLFCSIEIKHYSLHKYGQIKYAKQVFMFKCRHSAIFAAFSHTKRSVKLVFHFPLQ